MTTTPLPPLPELRGGIVKHTILGELYDRLQVEQRMVAYATQARADLEAEVQRLREALDWCVAEINRDSPAVINARATLEKTK